MSERCLTLGCPEVVRVAKIDPCSGLAEAGAGNGYAMSCIRNWSIEPIVTEGESSEFTSDCGNMVIRDKQDDQLLGYTISFETSQRSNEFEALVTGKELVVDGADNVGTYGAASNLGCTSPALDPRFVVECFYKLSKCVSGANHVRVVLPMVQFKVTTMDREGTISFYKYTAETGIALASALLAGPYGDFPVDVTAFLAARDDDEYTTGFDFEENISITGFCGAIEVPVLFDCADLTFASSFHDGGDPDVNLLQIDGPLTSVDKVVVTTDGPSTYTSHDPLGANVAVGDVDSTVWTNSQIVLDLTAAADDETVTSIALYGTIGELIATCVPPDDLVFEANGATCTDVDNFVTEVSSSGPGNITLTGTFPDFGTWTSIMFDGNTSDPVFFPADPEVLVLNATTVSITAAILEDQIVSAVIFDDGVTPNTCTFDTPLDLTTP